MSSLTLATLGTVFLLALVHVLTLLFKRVVWWNKLGKLPTLRERAWPLVGHLYLFPKEVGKVYFHWMQLMLTSSRFLKQKFLVFWLSSVPICAIVRPEAAEVVLKSNSLLDKPSTYKNSVTWLGDGLVFSTGKKWRTRRRLLTPSFHFKILEDFLDVMNEQADVFVDKIRELEDRGEVDLIQKVVLCTLDIICETAMGIRVGVQGDEDHYYLRALERMAEINRIKVSKPLYNINFILNMTPLGWEQQRCNKVLQKFTRDIIDRRVAEHNDEPAGVQTKGKKLAFLDMLMSARTESGDKLTSEDLQEEVDTFMFAGHDTNAMALSWTLYLLGRYPEVQRKLLEEVERVFPSSSPQHVTTRHLSQLTYMDQVIKEAMRLFPPVSMIGRHLRESCEIDGYRIPKDTICYVMIFIMHRNPEVWGVDVKDFKPERFSKENSVGRHPFAFVPFSAGPRNCIGQRFAMMEQKVILSKFVKNFSVETSVKEEDLDISIGLITKPMNLTYKVLDR